jgi:hypothetical protein
MWFLRRLSEPVSLAFLAEVYRTQAVMCRQMTLMTVSPFKEGWLALATASTKLAEEAEATARNIASM